MLILFDSFNLFKKFAQGKVAYDDIFKNVSKDRCCLVIPIYERFHWFSAMFVESKIITVFDSLYKRKKVKLFSQLLQTAKMFTTAKKYLFKKEDWLLIQPQDIFKQTDGSHCGVIAFLQLYFLLGRRKYRMSLVENFKDIQIWLSSKLLLDHWNDMTLV